MLKLNLFAHSLTDLIFTTKTIIINPVRRFPGNYNEVTFSP